ncbi:hypothetical protein SCP_0201810 [Sparassis crispa]|uniref:Urea active transporter n=1 Tax=Sparassis crispa TaxID=139825 RepID=A0A401G9Y2_9APHY|nr:hypothetical protein SCP_0201810 [Sparassis crispa]GBE78984.1 hypothetical protein SCP_0201810 [Sparassis crispa]
MGKGGAVLILLVICMAVTSALSAELIGVSSLFAYDLYRTYYRPNATGADIVCVSHYFICVWAVWCGAWATILNAATINPGWLFYVLGLVLSPIVFPIGLTISGTINVTNLAEPYSAVTDGLTGLVFFGLVTISVSLANLEPAHYDFAGTRAIAVYDEVEAVAAVEDSKSSSSDENEGAVVAEPPKGAASRAKLMRVFKRAAWHCLALTVIVGIIVPLPIFLTEYTFSGNFYKFWVACTIVWAATSGIFCIILPVWESRMEMGIILDGAFRMLLRKSQEQ